MRKEQRIKKNRRQLITATIILVCILIGGAAAAIWLYQGNIRETEQTNENAAQNSYDSIRDNVVVDNDEPMEREIDFTTLKEENPDAYAWVWIPGTNIDYPILQSVEEEDDYYLNTTIEGEKGYPGSIYTEKYNSKLFTDPVTIVYGHNMKNGTMFSELHRYTAQSFFEEHPYVYIYLPQQTLKYKIFAAVTFDDRYILGNYNFRDEEDFQKYVDELFNSFDGNIDDTVTVTQSTKVLTLSTCISDQPSQRWLVNGTLVDMAEIEE